MCLRSAGAQAPVLLYRHGEGTRSTTLETAAAAHIPSQSIVWGSGSDLYGAAASPRPPHSIVWGSGSDLYGGHSFAVPNCMAQLVVTLRLLAVCHTQAGLDSLGVLKPHW